MSSEADPTPTIRQRLAHGFLALVGVCVLYAASFGPVWVLQCSTGFPSHVAMGMFYTPLALVAEKTSTWDYYAAYGDWCYRTFRPKEGYRVYDYDLPSGEAGE